MTWWIAVNFDYLRNFNSHAHVERDFDDLHYTTQSNYFNSHAHVERDTNQIITVFDISISTHTLTWSVTDFLVTRNENIGFQLTRSRGA